MADYNINAITRRVVFTGSAGLGPYAFSFEVLGQDDVAVYFNATKLTLTDIVQLFVAHRIPVLSEHNRMVMTALLKLQDGVVSTQENYFLRSQS